MANKDLYEILGIGKNATDAEIKSAYRKMAKQYHPDLYSTKPDAEKKQAEETFKEVNHAYEVLSDSQKRSNYDQYGTEDPMQGGFGGGSGFNGGGFGGFEDIINDIFGGGFGGRQNRSRGAYAEDGEDITLRLELTFMEAVFGCEKKIRVTRNEKCSDCGGSGGKDSSSVKTCTNCGGSGFVYAVQQSIFGQSRVQRVCPTCGGKGKIITDKCKTCKGDGIVRKQREVTVTVPAGVDENQVMNYRNEGHCGVNGGASGNLVVVIAIKGHEYFVRKGSDIYLEVPITFFEATAGAKIEVPTLKGDTFKITIPEGTQTGKVFRVKGYGVKVLKRETFGDMYVTVKVETPRAITKKQIDLLKAFDETVAFTQISDRYKYNKTLRK